MDDKEILDDVDIFDSQLTPKEEEQFYKDLSSIDQIDERLKSMMAGDIRRYFSAAPGSTGELQRYISKGMYTRTAQLLSGIIKSNKKLPIK